MKTFNASETPSDGPDLLKSHEVCGLGRISLRTLNRYVRDGKLAPVYLSPRARRFLRGDVHRFFGGGRSAPEQGAN